MKFLSELLSKETLEKLKTDGDYISFENGWFANKEGKLIVALNIPVMHTEPITFGEIPQ